MSSDNGEKSKIIQYLLGIVGTILFAWGCKVTAAVWDLQTGHATLLANYGNIMKQLDRIEANLHTLLEDKR